MNENPEGTPNPLNPSMPDSSRPETLGSVTENRPTSPNPPMRQAAGPVAQSMPLSQSTDTTNITATPDSAATQYPSARPMEKAPEPAPAAPKKKKTGLIIGAIICGLVALGCIIAAIVVALSAKQGDPVARAVEKIMSGNAPTNTTIDGTIKVNFNDTSSEVKNMNIALNSQMVNRSMINSTTATMTANLRSGSSFSIEASEVYATNGDLYLKVDGLNNLLNLGNDSPLVDDVYDLDEPDGTDGSSDLQGAVSALSGVIEKVNGNWLRISTDDFNSMSSMGDDEGSEVSCLASLFKDATGNSNTLSGIYSKYPFVASTSENLPVVSLKDPIYKVSIDDDNFTSFMREAENTDIFKDFASCMGYGSLSTNIDNMVEDLAELPDLYVEVDGNYDFTRLYFTIDEDETEAIFDLSLSYPANVNVSEPVEYKDLNELMQEIMTSMYSMQEVESDKLVAE